MKFLSANLSLVPFGSLPLGEVWIEINNTITVGNVTLSLPLGEVWIEIQVPIESYSVPASLPLGEVWIEILEAVTVPSLP